MGCSEVCVPASTDSVAVGGMAGQHTKEDSVAKRGSSGRKVAGGRCLPSAASASGGTSRNRSRERPQEVLNPGLPLETEEGTAVDASLMREGVEIPYWNTSVGLDFQHACCLQ